MNDQQDSPFAMISMEEAISRVLEKAVIMEKMRIPLMQSCGYIIAEDIVALDPFPSYRASIMDGYAVRTPLCQGQIYPLQESAFRTGVKSASWQLEIGKVAYITTGGPVPEGANAVIKIEDTASSGDSSIAILNSALAAGDNIREVGSDIAAGEVVLQKGELLQPAEIGLLATVGVTSVLCFKKPMVGVLSTGTELVDPWEQPTGCQIRDSNRATLLAAFAQDGLECMDMGIVADDRASVENAILNAVARCDVVVSSGGVSMGDTDFVKPTLQKFGDLHFGRINMKPGKPTTFASFPKNGDVSRRVLFFGLPGNPASCLVTKALLVDPCLKRMQGWAVEACLPPCVLTILHDDGSGTVRDSGTSSSLSIKLDKERPEYHRAHVTLSPNVSWVSEDRGKAGGPVGVATSTGTQRSSRLMSMKSANALLCLPASSSSLTAAKAGDIVPTLLLGPTRFKSVLNPRRDSTQVSEEGVYSAYIIRPQSQSLATTAEMLKGGGASDVRSDENSRGVTVIRVALLTISDRASQGVYPDESGPEMRRLLEAMNQETKENMSEWRYPWPPVSAEVVDTDIVPDDPGRIREKVMRWCDEGVITVRGGDNDIPHHRVDLVLTSGGTGFGLRDFTPETIRPLLHRDAPGVAQALLSAGLAHTPLAVLSRPVVGTRNSTLVCTLPGSVKAVRENFEALLPLLPRIAHLLRGND